MRCSLLILIVLLSTVQTVSAEVQHKKFTNPTAYLIVEVLDDDLIHIEVSSIGDGPATNKLLYTSPMVFKTDYSGPSSFTDAGNILETDDLKLTVNAGSLCIRFEDKSKNNAYLTTLCPDDLDKPYKGLDIDPAAIQHVYGLGQQFTMPGSADGDWTSLGVREGHKTLGNGFMGFEGGAVGNVQIPVMYAVGNDNLNYALFVDNVYKQTWNFNAFWWQTRMYGDQLRFYVMTGDDLPDLRADYLALTGRAPLPPRKAFGLWVSEFGYDNWEQIDTLKKGLRSEGFPVDGFVLDLNWFGGVQPGDASKSRMGRLNWDQASNDDNGYFFPDPQSRIAKYANDHIGLTVIEESYIANTTDTYAAVPVDLVAFHRSNGECDVAQQGNPVSSVDGFWGVGRMIDWSDPAAGDWIHSNRRFPNLVMNGVTVHWTDLGEPEDFLSEACYEGVETTVSGLKNKHSDIHNLYNLLWNKSIWDGYFNKRGQANHSGQVNRRPFIMTRSGAAGTQRFGAAMWSGDIPSSLRALATHGNAQLHMSFSGIDYYGADIGGFRRETLPYNDKQGNYRGYESELYTQWFANGAWFDVPVRPHTDNEFITVNPPYQTSPHLVGKKQSNLANIRQRYELIPYYYSLAYRAHLFGEPVIPPLVFYYQNDSLVRKMGHEKLIGRDLLVGMVARHGEYERDFYLPAGLWINYHSNEWFQSNGQVIKNLPVYRNGIFRLPVYVRAGAILPQMFVDEKTKDAFGHSSNGTDHNELIIKVYAGSDQSHFTLYEDDGQTLEYHANGRPKYHYRTTEINQKQADTTNATVIIDKAEDVNGNGAFPGAIILRSNVVKLVLNNAQATAVHLNGSALPRHDSVSAFDMASEGWLNAGKNMLVVKSKPMNVYNARKVFNFQLQPTSMQTSVNFVCDKGFTQPGESIYVLGSITDLGAWDTDKAIKLDPNIYYDYIDSVKPPPNHTGPGPSAPVWSGVIAGLPPNTGFEWKCIRKHEDGTGAVQWEPGKNNTHHTLASGYAGRSYGSF